MKVVNTGNTYQIYDNTLKTYDALPAQAYIVRFSKNSGFFLEKSNDIEIKETKIYGVHETKANKVIASYNAFNKNLGVILSGDKGIGKSLFARILAKKAIDAGLPVIIVNNFIPGISDFIEEISQEVMILFDEFDKTFKGSDKDENTAKDPQTSMLSLFDGTSTGKKLFVITCNETRKLNEYIVNRPGRFHYHFRFEYPAAEEITMYLQDKLDEKYHSEINNVVIFSKKVNLNFDCLRAIAFELNLGVPFKDAIKDLNIINTGDQYYNIIAVFENGSRLKHTRVSIDLFDMEKEFSAYMLDSGHYDIGRISFPVKHCEYSFENDKYIVNKEHLTWNFYDYNLEEEDFKSRPELTYWKENKPEYILISKVGNNGIHYMI